MDTLSVHGHAVLLPLSLGQPETFDNSLQFGRLKGQLDGRTIGVIAPACGLVHHVGDLQNIVGHLFGGSPGAEVECSWFEAEAILEEISTAREIISIITSSLCLINTTLQAYVLRHCSYCRHNGTR